MNPARAPRERRDDARLLAVDSRTGQHADLQVADLPALLRAGDLLVVNDAATLPASLHGVVRGDAGAQVELRLAGAAAPPADIGVAPVPHKDSEAGEENFWAVLFGAGDWRTPTEHRPPPPRLVPGDCIALTASLEAQVLAVSPISARLLLIRFSLRGAALWAALYAHGRPVQYSYLKDELALWSVQTVYGGRPWAAEMPSAGRPLSWDLLGKVRQRGVAVAWLTHAAGLSSTGDPELDAALPLPERYELPEETVRLIAQTRRQGGRIIAVGTTVVRALEGAAQAAEALGAAPGTLVAGAGITSLVLQPTTPLRVVDGILTGIHSPDESHFRLLAAFCPLPRLTQTFEHAMAQGYLCHEFGDLSLIARDLGASQQRFGLN